MSRFLSTYYPNTYDLSEYFSRYANGKIKRLLIPTQRMMRTNVVYIALNNAATVILDILDTKIMVI